MGIGYMYLYLIEDKYEYYMNMVGFNFDRSDILNLILL